MAIQTTTPMSDSPIVQPLHNPSLAAQIVVPQAPLGNLANQASGMGAKSLLAKRLAKNTNPNFVSPTDNMMTPCTQKLSAAKKKHFTKLTKPIQLFSPQNETEEEVNESSNPPSTESDIIPPLDDCDENPF